jgi:hypothetical protein
VAVLPNVRNITAQEKANRVASSLEQQRSNLASHIIRSARHEIPSKTAAELEASIKVQMEDICDWPTDMTFPFSLMATVGRWQFCKKEQKTTPNVGK